MPTNADYCKTLARHFGWTWYGCSLDDEIEGRASGMFGVGYNALTVPMCLIRLACAGIGPVVACDKCDKPNDRAAIGNYCSSCHDAYQTRIARNPETRPIGSKA